MSGCQNRRPTQESLASTNLGLNFVTRRTPDRTRVSRPRAAKPLESTTPYAAAGHDVRSTSRPVQCELRHAPQVLAESGLGPGGGSEGRIDTGADVTFAGLKGVRRRGIE